MSQSFNTQKLYYSQNKQHRQQFTMVNSLQTLPFTLIEQDTTKFNAHMFFTASGGK